MMAIRMVIINGDWYDDDDDDNENCLIESNIDSIGDEIDSLFRCFLLIS